MSLKDQLKEDMKAAMKAREEGKIALSVIRMVNSAIKNTEINDKIELDDNGVLGILAKEMKTRQDSLTEFEKAGREDLISHVKEEMYWEVVITAIRTASPSALAAQRCRKGKCLRY